eukprot:1779680-Alexandrium_andersonii.AAC.1
MLQWTSGRSLSPTEAEVAREAAREEMRHACTVGWCREVGSGSAPAKELQAPSLGVKWTGSHADL